MRTPFSSPVLSVVFSAALWGALGCETSAPAAAPSGSGSDSRSWMQRTADNMAESVYTPLGQAAKDGDLEKVKRLLDQGADPDETKILHEGMKGPTAYIGAWSAHHQDVVRLLNAHCARIFVPGKNCASALEMAASVGDDESAGALLSKGADPNGKGPVARQRMLTTAAIWGKTGVMKLLLDKGAEVDGFDDIGGTALAAAAASGRQEAVELLLSRGAKVDKTSTTGLMPSMTALAWAAYGGKEDMARFLLSKGADMARAKSTLSAYLSAAQAKNMAAGRMGDKAAALLDALSAR